MHNDICFKKVISQQNMHSTLFKLCQNCMDMQISAYYTWANCSQLMTKPQQTTMLLQPRLQQNKFSIRDVSDPPFRVLVMQYIQCCGSGQGWFTRLPISILLVSLHPYIFLFFPLLYILSCPLIVFPPLFVIPKYSH